VDEIARSREREKIRVAEVVVSYIIVLPHRCARNQTRAGVAGMNV